MLFPSASMRSQHGMRHNLLINYFNNSIPSDTKEIYQFDITGKVSNEDSVNQVGKKGKGRSKKSKGQSKGKGSSQNQNQKGKGKSKGQSKGKTKSKGKGQWTTWSGQTWSWNQNQDQGGKGKGKGHQVCSHCGRKGHSVDQSWWAPKTSWSWFRPPETSVQNLSSAWGSFRLNHAHRAAQRISRSQTSSSTTTTQSTLLLTTIIFISCVINLCLWPRSRIQWTSLRINHFTSGLPEDHIMGVNISNPIYDIGPSLPQKCQGPWAALIDTGPVASIAPQSFVPHIPVKEKAETLTSVNGGNIKVLGIKHVACVTGKVIAHINFLIVEDVKNPIIGLDAIHRNHLQVHLHGKGKCILRRHQHKAPLHYHQSHYHASGLVLPDHFQSHHLRWSDPQYTTLDKQSASNIIAEIDDKIISDSRKIILEESQEDFSQQAQVPHCLKVPSTPSAAERELHELTHLPLRSWCEICQRAKGLQGQHKHRSQKKSNVIQLDHSFYKVPGSVQNRKVLITHQKYRSAVGKLLTAQPRDDLNHPVKELSRSLINPQDQDIKNLIHLLKCVNQTRDFVFVMEPQLPVRNQEGKFPVQIVSYSDSDWAGCQKSRKSTSGSLVSVFNVNLQSTSRTQASVAHSSAESELYAMTQAAVESRAIKNCIQEFSSAILSSSVSIVMQTDSSAGKSMASSFGISRRSSYIELQYLWIQDEVKEGKLELKKVGTHFNPSDALTKYVPASVLGQHLPRLTIFKVNSQRSKSVHSQQNQFNIQPTLSHPQLHRSRQTPLLVFMLSVNFDHQEELHQRLRQASRSIKRVLTPPRRGSGDQGDSNLHRRRNVIHHDSEVQENQGAGVGVIESAPRDSESVAHGQQPPPPPQNQESQESTSQWRSWIRSRFSVSASLSSLSWRRRQDQGRNQENQEKINQ